MCNYQNGKIYAIKSYQTDLVYIGSTTQNLSRRLSRHKSGFKLGQFICSSSEILKFNDNYIELVEAYPCSSKIELHRREGQIIRNTDNCVNKIIAGRTCAEYRNENKNKISNINKQYREKNREKIRQYREDNIAKIAQKKKQYYENNKESIIQKTKNYYENNKEVIIQKNKQYAQNNKEKISQKSKQYRQNNKEKIRQYMNQKINCDCGGKYTQIHKIRHYSSKKHLNYIFAITAYCI